MSLHPSESGYYQKDKILTAVGEYLEKEEGSHPVAGNIKFF